MKKDYVIWTPSYCASNGVKILHLLYKELEKRGFNVYLYSFPPCTQGFKYLEKISEDVKNNAIVIYPEVVTGNPLRFKNVVRYVLNSPGLLGGSKKYHQSEVIFTHIKAFYPQANILTFPWIDETVFYNANLPKTQDCYFVYKGGEFRDAKETQGLFEININYPKTQKELADLLKTTGILYSYDNCSSLLDEAVLCGAQVKIITKEGIEDYKFKYYKLIENFEQNMNNFIETTQKMNYNGKIEKIHKWDCVKKFIYVLKLILFKYLPQKKAQGIKYRSIFKMYFG